MTRYGWFLCLAAAMLHPPVAFGHPEPDLRIRALSRRIERNPADAELYLQRGTLLYHNGDYRRALSDCRRAGQLDPQLTGVDFLEARLHLELGRPDHALAVIERFRQRQPDHVGSGIIRARALAGLGRISEASAEYRDTLARLPDPRPEHYRECAGMMLAQTPRLAEHFALSQLGAAPVWPGVLHQADQTCVTQALETLDAGIHRIGPVVSLQLFAVDLETYRGRVDAALERLQTLMSQAQRKERWLLRQGQILERAGRLEQARSAYHSALQSIAALPRRHRNVPATRTLEQQAHGALRRLNP